MRQDLGYPDGRSTGGQGQDPLARPFFLWYGSAMNFTTVEREAVVAHALACVAHFGQTSVYSKEIYTNHLRRVSRLVPFHYRAVAWLHDVLEDTALTADHLKAGGISPETIRSVEILTRHPDEGQTYDQYLDSIVESGDEGALLVKVADLRDHIRSDDPIGGRAVLPLDRITRYENALERLRLVCLDRGVSYASGLRLTGGPA